MTPSTANIELSSILVELVKYVGYIATIFAVAYKLGQRITVIELTIKHTVDSLNKHIERVDKMFDKLEERMGK